MSLQVNTKILACPVCHSKIGMVDISKLTLPLTGDMFDSLWPDNGAPKPFAEWAGWMDFRCRRCHKRPYQEFNVIYTMDDAGFLERHEIEDKPTIFKCGCGKEYQHETSLIRHQKDCTWQK